MANHRRADLIRSQWSFHASRGSGSRPLSRVLSRAIIHLGLSSPTTSSDLPEDIAGNDIVFLFGLAPGGVYHATNCYQLRGALLPHHFTLTCITDAGGIFSVALSVGSRPPGVTWHPALWSPDFPPFRRLGENAIAWPAPVAIVHHPGSLW